jgi:isocitrate lyase
MLLIARTDSESAKLISSTVDVNDHEFIKGTTTKSSKGLSEVLADAEARGASGAEVDKLEKEWTDNHEMCTFDQGGGQYVFPSMFLNCLLILSLLHSC